MSIRADLVDLREQFNEFKVQIDNSISDKVNGAISEATEELKQYIEDEVAKAVAELETYDGGENTQDTTDDSEIMGASRLRKTTTKKVYTLGASAQTQRPIVSQVQQDDYSSEISSLRDEITALRAELDELKSSKNHKNNKSPKKQ